MYNIIKLPKTQLIINKSYLGETIEHKINRIVNNKEPIKDGAPLIYQERKDGVQPQYDIRTDRFEVALDAMNYVNKSHIAKRQNRLDEAKNNMEKEKKTETEPKNNSGAEPTQTTDNK